jgi:N-acetylneuraminate synthase
VKFQAYSAEALASKDSPAYWDTTKETINNQYDLFQQYDDFGESEFNEIAEWTTSNHDIAFLSTPFDYHAVEYLDPIVPAYKIASADITNHPLLRQIAQKHKPILLSTGASSIGEINDAVQIIEEESSNPELCLLHCILQYPTDRKNANLAMIKHLSEIYPEYMVGYSDHVLPDDCMLTLVNAVVHGAQIIEKHFTLDKNLEGNDHYHAMNPEDVQTFRKNIQHIRQTRGQYRKQSIKEEEDSRKYARRSLVAANDICKGDTILQDDLAIKRPGTGISPPMMNSVVGRKTKRDIDEDEILCWDIL